jgi:hypothetical protein
VPARCASARARIVLVARVRQSRWFRCRSCHDLPLNCVEQLLLLNSNTRGKGR